MKPLLDVNVVLDFLLVRQPWYAEAAQVWDAHRDGRIVAGVAAFTLPTLYYVIRRHSDLQRAGNAVQLCLATLEIAPVQRSTLELARTLPGSDFEDNLQLACAMEAGMDSVVTRNPSDFTGSPLPILTPAELLARLAQASPTPP